MKVLVTGASGVLGHTLVPQLVEKGYDIRLFDMVPTPESLHDAVRSVGREARIESITGDMRDKAALSEACHDVEVVHHLAAGQRMKPQFASLSEQDIFDMNLTGVQNVLDAAREKRARRVVFISSSAVYGIPRTELVDEETHPKEPLGAYGASKLEAEKLCLQAIDGGQDVAMLRPMSLFGDGMTGVFVLLFDWVRRNRRVFLLGSGANRVQMVAADDVSRCAILAATSDKARGLVVNVGSPPESVPSVRAQCEALIAYAGASSKIMAFPAALLRNAARVLNLVGMSPIVPEHYKLADVNFVLDISRARENLGWEPSGDNIKITCDAYDWYLENWERVAPKPNLPLRILEAVT
ncbi:MAG: SDR family NAD(P)-dependent oxidoreductase [Candidatus Binatia bacterium]|jgi:nucleoside-diphosphate-sugar epimerase|nr:SDR family NAD(P)-dependent oxidoreductase [Candidatus Binatia bacterium]MDG2009050.1 SDR family NAD(P)-dependent oxidoreductase [Candidatus Binatia bacterium]